MATQLVKSVYKICIPHSGRDYFDYLSGDFTPAIGSRVWVPFRNKTRLGVVIRQGLAENCQTKLKTIDAVIDEQSLLSESILSLCQWVSDYYQSPLSEVIPLALPKKYRLGAPTQLPVCDYFELAIPIEKARVRLSPQAKKQQALVDFLSQHSAPLAKTKLTAAGFGQAQLKALLAMGLVSLSQQIFLPTRLSPPVTVNLP